MPDPEARAPDEPREVTTDEDSADAFDSTGRKHTRLRFLLIAGLVAVSMAGLGAVELRTSWLQSLLLADYAGDLGYALGDGPSPSIRFPSAGPYDRRLGYSALPELLGPLTERGFDITAQARVSPRFSEVVDRGGFPIYREKTVAGLRVLDSHGRPIFEARYPDRTFATFDDIPTVIVRSLLHIENRALLDDRFPYRNPAIEWDRAARAVVQLGLRSIGGEEPVPGASTLATQMEKFRHSPDGVTSNASEKLRQIASASLRAYRDGRVTVEAQRRIVLDYVNSVPLAGIVGYGEVNGLGAGLWSWYGIDVAEAASLLAGGGSVPRGREEDAGVAYRGALSLLLAHRRPSYYLANPAGRAALVELTDRHLRLLEQAGVVSPTLAAAARSARPVLRTAAPATAPVSFQDRKAASAIRTRLLGLLDVPRLYVLDRLDLTVRSTIDDSAQRAVNEELRRLRDPAYVRSTELAAPRLLQGADPTKVVYTVLLQEQTPRGNLVRVQTDNIPGPFDPNEAAKLELGSTAKLRTLVTYLGVVERLYVRLAPLSLEERAAEVADYDDPLTRWMDASLRSRPEMRLEDALEMAMERRYSASPAERFFTGGGVHTFSNFDATFDGQSPSVREAFRHSVNLVFIRLMRDVVRYHMLRIPGSTARILADPAEPRRQEYLARFADQEGRIFVRRFYEKHRGRTPEASLGLLVGGRHLTPLRLARVYRSVFPGADEAAVAAFLRVQSPEASFMGDAVSVLYRQASPSGFTLADLGHLVGVHPLEIWVARYLLEHPDAALSELTLESTQARQDVYGWLFETRRRGAQDTRIGTLLEVEAFLEIQRDWKRLGYPFENLVPSYATAIGSSGDRPAALAELVGIVLSDGVRMPTARLEELHFAESTPYETILRRRSADGQRVLSVEVARTVRGALTDVVENGTARRLRSAFTAADGSPIPTGGKTGTGDNRLQVFGAGGRVLESRPLNRTSAFAFFVGDRFYGVITAYVEGGDADRYAFTSSLPVQVLRQLVPALTPLIESPPPLRSVVR